MSDNAPKPGSTLLRWLLVLIVLLGFALRIYDLDGQSMWSDEGLSLYRAQQSLSQVFKSVITVDGIDTQDTNPPAYFLLLHLFRALAGESVFVLRFAGAAAATLAVPLMYALGRVTFGRRSGLLAAFLMAISPFHVWQSQVLRNYGLLISLNLLSVYGLSRFILAPAGRRRWQWLALWAAAGLLGIVTHYFAFFIFAFGALALLATIVAEWNFKRLLRQRAVWLALGLSLLLIIPIISIAYDRFAAGQQVDFYFVPLPTIMRHAASAYSAGMEPTLIQPWWRVIPALLLFLAGLWYGWRARRKATALMLGYQIVPLAILFGLSFINPLYNGTRHLLIGLPPFLIFVARGIAGPTAKAGEKRPVILFNRLWRWAGLILGIVVIASQIQWLQVQFTSPRLIRDDVRGAAEYLSARAGPDDIIILHDTLIKFTFDPYYDGLAPVVAIPKYGQTDPAGAIRALQAAAEGKEKVWFLTDPAPRNGLDGQVLIDWAAENWLPASAQSFQHMWLKTGLVSYVPDPAAAAIPATSTPLDISWENNLRLRGYDGSELVRPGVGDYDQLLTLLHFSQVDRVDEPFKITWILVDGEGAEWLKQTQTVDPEEWPGAAEGDQIVRLARQLAIPYGLPPGDYTLLLRLNQAGDGRPLVTAGGESQIQLASVMVAPSTCTPDPDLPIRLGDEIEMHGDYIPAEQLLAGQTISLRFWWCAVKTPRDDYRLRLQLVNERGAVVGESINPLARPDLPPTSWQTGQLIMSEADLSASEWSNGGQHDLRLSFLAPDSETVIPMSGRRDEPSVSLGTLRVMPGSYATEVPAISRPLKADFGEPPLIELHGYDLTVDEAAAGDALDLTLYWRSLTGDIPESYTVFIHLVDEAGQFIAQGDDLPLEGRRPTDTWRASEVIIDGHVLTIAPDASPGEARLLVGLYNAQNDQRLAAFQDGLRLPDDQIPLHSLLIIE